MLVVKNICNSRVIVGGKFVLPGRTAKVDSLNGIEGKVINGFLEVVEENEALVKNKVVKERPKIVEKKVMETKKEISEEDE